MREIFHRSVWVWVTLRTSPPSSTLCPLPDRRRAFPPPLFRRGGPSNLLTAVMRRLPWFTLDQKCTRCSLHLRAFCRYNSNPSPRSRLRGHRGVAFTWPATAPGWRDQAVGQEFDGPQPCKAGLTRKTLEIVGASMIRRQMALRYIPSARERFGAGKLFYRPRDGDSPRCRVEREKVERARARDTHSL